MTDTDKLVERLRRPVEWWATYEPGKGVNGAAITQEDVRDPFEAADTIEAQAQEIERLRKAQAVWADLDAETGRHPKGPVVALVDRAEAAELERDEAAARAEAAEEEAARVAQWANGVVAERDRLRAVADAARDARIAMGLVLHLDLRNNDGQRAEWVALVNRLTDALNAAALDAQQMEAGND